jgi:hypothetical protein
MTVVDLIMAAPLWTNPSFILKDRGIEVKPAPWSPSSPADVVIPPIPKPYAVQVRGGWSD